MEDKILGLQFEPVSAKPTRPSYIFQKLRLFVLKVNQDSSEYGRSGIHRGNCSQVFFKIGVQKSVQLYQIETPTQVLFCEDC